MESGASSPVFDAIFRVAMRRRPPARKKKRSAKSWPRLWGAYQRAPATAQLLLALLAVLLIWVIANGIFQVFRKPTELFFPVSGALYKTPTETWRSYAPIFRAHATRTISPELLAALAQVEGSGNPIVRTYWRWRWSARPFEIYRPASSAVGMYQLTDGTFEEARRWCIHDHVVVADGPWNAWRSCWFNALYARVIPTHAVEMTSADLDRKVSAILGRFRIHAASALQKERLAAVIHLCGAGAGNEFARRRFRLTDGQRCGDHTVREYVSKVEAMKSVFSGLARR
jgi:hypothetical protein